MYIYYLKNIFSYISHVLELTTTSDDYDSDIETYSSIKEAAGKLSFHFRNSYLNSILKNVYTNLSHLKK